MCIGPVLQEDVEEGYSTAEKPRSLPPVHVPVPVPMPGRTQPCPPIVYGHGHGHVYG
jgi:hypothetical protein